jgi:hypothetical protein
VVSASGVIASLDHLRQRAEVVAVSRGMDFGGERHLSEAVSAGWFIDVETLTATLVAVAE